MDTPINPANSVKLLGVIINKHLTWDDHVDAITKKANRRMYFALMLKRSGASPKDILRFYTAYIRPILEYACPVWHTGLTHTSQDKLEAVQRRLMKILSHDLSYREALNLYQIKHLSSRREDICANFFNSLISNNRTSHLLEPYHQSDLAISLRNRARFSIYCRTTKFQNSLIPYGINHFM